MSVIDTASTPKWHFCIDRGGTFTDIVAQNSDGILRSEKLLSENPEHYPDASLQGIRNILKVKAHEPIPTSKIASIRMGTTVATNALLEHKGDRTLLVVTRGFADALRIGYQARPKLFELNIKLPAPLYERVIEIDERVNAHGKILKALEIAEARTLLETAYQEGIRSCAICLMHAYRYPAHEKALAKIAEAIGFEQISRSSEVSPLIKFVSRAQTTLIDAYLSAVLLRYVQRISRTLPRVPLLFMQSSGGLAKAELFRARDSILSGPAGGIVGVIEASRHAGFEKIISFDMGGTSTDVSHFAGHYERDFNKQIGGMHVQAPMLNIHTVAAGGGSILKFQNGRYQVGPESAGANPGPASYRRGGPLTLTDCNIMLGRIQPKFFPALFGTNGAQPLDQKIVEEKFSALTDQINRATGDNRSPQEVAVGFLTVAINNMAQAIKKISVQRGHDVTAYTLCCFGGAGAQHACRVADLLGIKQILIHPLASVLSAYGMRFAKLRALRTRTVEAPLEEADGHSLDEAWNTLVCEAQSAVAGRSVEKKSVRINRRTHLRYQGSELFLEVDFANSKNLRRNFEALHQQRFGFILPDKAIVIASLVVEAIEDNTDETPLNCGTAPHQNAGETQTVSLYTGGKQQCAPLYRRENLTSGQRIVGPALIIDLNSSTIIERDWCAEVTSANNLILKCAARESPSFLPADTLQNPKVDAVKLEIFNNLYMSIAEQMGATLKNTAHSVNIKERLDFSCAVFDKNGSLVANAPHIPVHLGSMGESVRAIIKQRASDIQVGDVYALNNPYGGGTHLPDITVMTPVFPTQLATPTKPLFFVACRGHHADVGGITPGSMPAHSSHIAEEGVLIDNFLLLRNGQFREQALREILTQAAWPARNIENNIADLKAQIAANQKGVLELTQMVNHFGLETVQTYMKLIQDNAEAEVRTMLQVLDDGQFVYRLDNGIVIKVRISIAPNKQSATIDFSGSSAQSKTNFNAPAAVVRATVLYVFRTLIDAEIPLNDGCLKPIQLIIPEGSVLDPRYPAAVVAGNVETSQAIANALYAALGILSAAQGTMNNISFGNERYQYYETICGGAGAGADFDGASAVHTHMTNSRLTDPEVLEYRFPVLLEQFSIRQGSGGQGKQRGGDGVIRKLRFLEAMDVSILSSHRSVAPCGLAGAGSGAGGVNRLKRSCGMIEELPPTISLTVEAGDTLIIKTPGGGGFGTPQ